MCPFRSPLRESAWSRGDRRCRCGLGAGGMVGQGRSRALHKTFPREGLIKSTSLSASRVAKPRTVCCHAPERENQGNHSQLPREAPFGRPCRARCLRHSLSAHPTFLQEQECTAQPPVGVGTRRCPLTWPLSVADLIKPSLERQDDRFLWHRTAGSDSGYWFASRPTTSKNSRRTSKMTSPTGRTASMRPQTWPESGIAASISPPK